MCIRDRSETDEPFDEWFFRQSYALLDGLQAGSPEDTELQTLRVLLDSMQEFGSAQLDSSEETFLTAFKAQVLDVQQPKFMNEPFSGIFDPFRFLAQIVATLAFSASDPPNALRLIAHSYGDTDTTAAILGTLMGAWYGEQRLRSQISQALKLSDQLDIVEGVLVDLLEINLDEQAKLFMSLREKGFTARPKTVWRC